MGAETAAYSTTVQYSVERGRRRSHDHHDHHTFTCSFVSYDTCYARYTVYDTSVLQQSVKASAGFGIASGQLGAVPEDRLCATARWQGSGVLLRLLCWIISYRFARPMYDGANVGYRVVL